MLNESHINILESMKTSTPGNKLCDFYYTDQRDANTPNELVEMGYLEKGLDVSEELPGFIFYHMTQSGLLKTNNHNM